MTKNYAVELKNLSKVYNAALSINVNKLCKAIESWLNQPMIMVGSGGSFSTASFAAFLHERSSNHLARAATPLDIGSESIPQAGIVCFSASGRNRDILSAYRTAALEEIDPLSALVLSEESPLHDLAARFQYTDLIALPHPVFKDGFLAVASLIASAILLLRAYRAALGLSDLDLPDSLDSLIDTTTSFSSFDEVSQSMDEVTSRPFVSVLYTQPLAAVAVDLESRFVEAALGALHVADLRNFGHGRHVWLAKKSAETGVLALISENQQLLGQKTLALLPKQAAVKAVSFRGSYDIQALAGLVVGLSVAESAGRQAGIDPGRPGVPSFGRALYHLKPDAPTSNQKRLNQFAAIRRKGCKINDSSIARYRRTHKRLTEARFGALVADYDGTLCDARLRFDPLSKPIVKELTRLCKAGARIGVATGRGPSAGKELRHALTAKFHDQILVGYYNCAVIRPLTDETDPIITELSDIHPVATILSEDALFCNTDIRANEVQISIGLKPGVQTGEAVIRARTLLRDLEVSCDVVASSHSIDVLLNGQSKRNIIGALESHYGVSQPFLRLGDKGRWPGNDADLLDDPFGFSVDEVSQHPDNCWSLAPAGIKGMQATVYYLQRLHWTRNGGRLKLTLGARG